MRDESHHAEHCDPDSKEHVWCLDLWLTRWLNSDPTPFVKVPTEKAEQQPRAVIFSVIISLMVSVQATEEAELLPSQEYEFSLPTTAPLWTTAFAFPIKSLISRSLSEELEHLSSSNIGKAV